jgi:hypothetical protein
MTFLEFLYKVQFNLYTYMFMVKSAAQPDVDQPNFHLQHLVVQLIDRWPCLSLEKKLSFLFSFLDKSAIKHL